MANRTLTFSGNKFSVTATVNGVSVTSPYELTKSCTIVITPQNGDYASWTLNGSNITTSYPEYYLEDVDITFYDNGDGIPGPPEGYITIHYTHAPAPSGYTITFNSNGGTTFSDIEDATELPTLPTPTKSGYTFVAWYYESNFQTRAKAGDTIESNVTLYAKWHNLGSLFTEIADAIRSKDGTNESIRDVDFGERVKQIQGAKEEETKTVTPNFSSGNQVITPTSGKVLSQVTLTKPTDLLPENIAKDKNVCGVVGTSFRAIELTQTQYDALSTKDSNTYYLIVEE